MPVKGIGQKAMMLMIFVNPGSLSYHNSQIKIICIYTVSRTASKNYFNNELLNKINKCRMINKERS